MNYDSMTLIQLKTMCKDRGLRVSGNKAEVVIRLMEDDEGELPQQVNIPMQQMTQFAPQIIRLENTSKVFPVVWGLLIIFYAMFRSYVGMMFLTFDGEGSGFEALIAIALGLGYLLCGVITMQGHKEGIYGTLIVLLISGSLSIIYHNEFSPLSIGMGDVFPLEWTICCSASCIMIVSIPLLAAPNEFKEGESQLFNSVIGKVNTVRSSAQSTNSTPPSVEDKVVISCDHCSKSLKVPSDFSGNVRCPMCKEKFRVD
ncbi:MAG: hypothetical protein CMA11_01945 [Euryarchaeota archaeon]|nr:hypothetical protein [Euryarchaeota archaeon]